MPVPSITMQAALEPHPTGTLPHGNVRAVLARPGFRRLLVARLVSQLGDGWFQAGLAGSVFFNPDRAATPAAFAAAFALLLVPYSMLGPFVGVFLDRWSRRNTLVVANAVRAAAVLPASYVVWQGREGPWLVTAALLIVALNRFYLSGLSAAQPHVVDQERLVTANSFATTVGSVLYAGGIGAAGAIFRLAGTSTHVYAIVTVASAGGYLAAAAIIGKKFAPADLGPDDTERASGTVLAGLAATVRGMLAGVRHLGRRRAASTVLIANAVQRGIYGLLFVTVLLLYRNYYSDGNLTASMGGLLLVAMAAALGPVVAAFVTPPATRRLGGPRWLAVMFGGLAVAVPALGLPYRPVATVACAFLISLVTQASRIVTDTALQVEVADDYRGRVFSINDTAINLMYVGGLSIGALILPDDGHAPAVMLLAGVGYAALTAWYVMARPHPIRLA
jgi:hypothetical protein